VYDPSLPDDTHFPCSISLPARCASQCSPTRRDLSVSVVAISWPYHISSEWTYRWSSRCRHSSTLLVSSILQAMAPLHCYAWPASHQSPSASSYLQIAKSAGNIVRPCTVEQLPPPGWCWRHRGTRLATSLFSRKPSMHHAGFVCHCWASSVEFAPRPGIKRPCCVHARFSIAEWLLIA